MTWLSQSHMARRGVAGGRPGTRHRLTEEMQGTYHYVYGPYAAPVMRIAPGDVVEVETLDAFGGAVKTEDDLPSKVLNMPFVNPQNGPIAVDGAEKGDVLAVYIHSLLPRGPQPAGTTALIMLSEVVFASVSSVLLAGTVLDARTVLGGSLIVSAALLATLRWPRKA